MALGNPKQAWDSCVNAVGILSTAELPATLAKWPKAIFLIITTLGDAEMF
jgi:hypothetical protein